MIHNDNQSKRGFVKQIQIQLTPPSINVGGVNLNSLFLTGGGFSVNITLTGDSGSAQAHDDFVMGIVGTLGEQIHQQLQTINDSIGDFTDMFEKRASQPVSVYQTQGFGYPYSQPPYQPFNNGFHHPGQQGFGVDNAGNCRPPSDQSQHRDTHDEEIYTTLDRDLGETFIQDEDE